MENCYVTKEREWKGNSLKLVSESIEFSNQIYLTHNGKRGKRIISVEKICISVRSKKPTVLRNNRGNEFKYKNLSDESKHVVNEIVESNRIYL
jgi:hypothetical protein